MVSKQHEYDVTDKEPKKIDITVEKINSILGTVISKEDILDCFRKLAFDCEVNGDTITVTVPTRPNSSPKTEKIKSFCASGSQRYFSRL